MTVYFNIQIFVFIFRLLYSLGLSRCTLIKEDNIKITIFWLTLIASTMPHASHKETTVVIAHSEAKSGRYIGSPSLAILPSGHYIASHDYFGPEANHKTQPTTVIYKSINRGKTWEKVTEIQPLFWSKLFVHQNILYSLGTQHEYGNVLIRSSKDEGRTWTEPATDASGLLKKGSYHCAPCPVTKYNGLLWRSLELAEGERPRWGAMVMSAPVDANLLDSRNWRFSEPLFHTPSDGQWIEGNTVVAPSGNLVNILRTNGSGNNRAVITHISSDGLKLSHDKNKDVIHFPGGGVKFTILYDQDSALYWTIVNDQQKTGSGRNNLVLSSSKDLYQWHIELPLYSHPDQEKYAWQYSDWLIEYQDIIFVSRTAGDDKLSGAHSAHDANYLTFHRITDFRIPKLRKLSTFTASSDPSHR